MLTTSERRYWALAAHPKTYRVAEAVCHLTVDTWTSKGKAVQKGDRVIIWKYKGRDANRGIVALGEVLSNPEPKSDFGNAYWIVPPHRNQTEDRISVQYLINGNLPLWLDDDSRDILDQLTVSRAQGGTVFQIPPDIWDDLIVRLGGWPK